MPARAGLYYMTGGSLKENRWRSVYRVHKFFGFSTGARLSPSTLWVLSQLEELSFGRGGMVVVLALWEQTVIS